MPGIGAGGNSAAEDFARWIDDPELTVVDWRRGRKPERPRRWATCEPGRRGRRAGGSKLMRITLNLATRPFADIGPALKRLRIAMAVLVVIGIGLGLGLHAFHQKAEEARATEQLVQSKIDAINAGAAGLPGADAPAGQRPTAGPGRALNQLFDEKTFSWTLAMEDLETVLPGGVQVTQPRAFPRLQDRPHHPESARGWPPRPRRRSGQNLEHSKHFLLAPHCGRKLRIHRRTQRAAGAGERLEPRQLRTAGRVQPGSA
jgi:hypothetical protein